jgi:hypothetical protein
MKAFLSSSDKDLKASLGDVFSSTNPILDKTLAC